MYKEREILYILYGDESVLALSLNNRDIYQYYFQFKSYFDETYSQVTVVPIVSKNESTKIIDKYLNTHWLQWLTDEIIVTEREYDFYIKILQGMYEDTKNMMSQLLVLNKFTNFSAETKKQLIDTFNITYENIKSFNDFVSNIDSNEFFKVHMHTPNLIEQYYELNLLMHMNIEKDK